MKNVRGVSRLALTTAAAFGLFMGPAVADNFHKKFHHHGYHKHHAKKLVAFERIATFPVYRNTCDGLAGAALEACVDEETVAEIVAASKDGKTLIYTDSEKELLGFVDIANPHNPAPGGTVALPGEPTSVEVAGDYALVAVNTSADFVSTSGDLIVVHIPSQTVAASLPLGGQPDSVAVSPDGRYAAIAIENERDEDLGDGGLPQLPAGFLVIVDLVGPPAAWTTRMVDLTGIADETPEDPEPEFVDINKKNIAAVSLQENNHMVLVRLKNGKIIGDFSAGDVSLKNVDNNEDGSIALADDIDNLVREPDAIGWVGNRIATANEGDWKGGSRGFTLFKKNGKVKFDSAESLDYIAVRHGQYPEDRSENKGSEPEGIEVGKFGRDTYLFVGLERANIVATYRMQSANKPRFIQALPAGGIGPEGIKAVPKRGLVVIASENDERGDAHRSALSIFRLKRGTPTYPHILSNNRPDTADTGAGLPIPWGALSALAADRWFKNRLYTVPDSAYAASRIFVMDTSKKPARITNEIVLKKAGATIDRDLEGLAKRPYGGFWAVSEGSGSVDDPGRPVESLNLLMKIAPDGTVLDEIELPAATNGLQRRFGFEGVTTTGWGSSERVYVAFQREWVGDPDGMIRIGQYNPAADEWKFFYYPKETPISPNGGWVGLSEIVAVDEDTLAVIERDNQGSDDARIKRIYKVSIAGVTPVAEGGVIPVLNKTLVRDILPDLAGVKGQVAEKVEGMTIARGGRVFVVTDNDGVDDASGETVLLRLGRLFR